MIAALLFAVAVAGFAVMLGVAAARAGRWPEVGMCGASTVLAGFLAAVAVVPGIPIWLVLMVAWAVLALLVIAVWSVVRGVDKARTGEDAR